MNATYPLHQAECPFPKRFMLWLMILMIFVGTLNLLISHADRKHGEDANKVRQCLNGGGELQQWVKGNRLYRVCQVDDGKIGIQILEKIDDQWYEITSYVKNKMRTINQVERYLENCGATRFK